MVVELVVPTVHLNGTSKNGLIEPLNAAYHALNTALRAMAEAAPNGRDYYPQGADVIYKAQDQHFARMSKVTEVREELARLIEEIDAGGFRR